VYGAVYEDGDREELSEAFRERMPKNVAVGSNVTTAYTSTSDAKVKMLVTMLIFLNYELSSLKTLLQSIRYYHIVKVLLNFFVLRGKKRMVSRVVFIFINYKVKCI